MNQLVLTACIAQVGALRYTPAGLPAIDMHLEHESHLQDAGQPRQVKAGIRAVAFGTLAETLGRQTVGSAWTFTGYLATPRSGKHAVLHIQQFQPI